MLSSLNENHETNLFIRRIIPVIFIIIFPISVAIIVLIFIHQQHRRRILREGLDNHNNTIVSNSERLPAFSSFLSSFLCFKKRRVQTNPKECHSQENSFNDTIPENYLHPVLFPSQEDLNIFTRAFHSDSNGTRYHTGLSVST
ncbi:hypothetical protein PMAC_001086 [Pneumocystis sp. 'macacae']|nr:hypothetical protein PMAC_001086 [Pneumocystis sp. 'macacae']